MRKLLMATAAMLGASLGMADAAQVFTASPTALTGLPPSATSLTTIGAGARTPAAPAPGQIVVRIDLRENIYAVAGWSNFDSVGGNKQQPYGIIGYPRFYLGFDGKATNGLNYGLYWEIRNGANRNSVVNNAASGTAGNAGSSGSSSDQTLFWRRNYGYIGTDTLGTLRIGETDGPMSSFLVATFDDFATGLWNGDINDWIQGGSYGLTGAFPNWPFFDVGAEYTTAKAVYLSPSFAGVDFALSFEPSTANVTDSQTCPNTAPAGQTFTGANFVNCSSQSTSNAANDLQRRRNTIEGGIRYRGAFSGVGIAASAIGAFGGHVNAGPFNPGVGGGSFTDIHGKTITLKPTSSFDSLKIGDVGLAVTFAGVTVGGNIIFGDYNGQMAPNPSGATNSLAWIAGAEYAWGPIIVGGAYFRWKYQGYWTLPGEQTDQGIQFGVTYNIAPGLALLAEYLYGQRYRGNFDFSKGAPGPNFNNVHSQVAGVGLQFRW
ncbi:MAG TPA: hypothetical protein VLI93_03020 [Acetobacteraceae bacterium]|nr:hypothetical protein [Acetobacteraceae bacterium]